MDCYGSSYYFAWEIKYVSEHCIKIATICSKTDIDCMPHSNVHVLVVSTNPAWDSNGKEILAMLDEIILADKVKSLLNSTNMAAMTYDALHLLYDCP